MELTLSLTYLSDWWRMNFLVLFLTILGFVRGLRAAMMTLEIVENIRLKHQPRCAKLSIWSYTNVVLQITTSMEAKIIHSYIFQNTVFQKSSEVCFAKGFITLNVLANVSMLATTSHCLARKQALLLLTIIPYILAERENYIHVFYCQVISINHNTKLHFVEY